ncbi:hypothetical protein NKDENANG_02640 [Candidatus Entotheonellaceae bacterium PAL068K]
MLDKGVDAVMVSYLHAYANPTNEQRTRPYIVLGSEMLPEFREFERTSTAASTYVCATPHRSLPAVTSQAAQSQGLRSRHLTDQSNGGAMSLEAQGTGATCGRRA